MAKSRSKFKLNLFDIVFSIIFIIVSFSVIFAFNNEPYLGSEDLVVKVVIKDADTISNIKSKLKSAKTVFVDNSRFSLKQLDYKISTKKSKSTLTIYLSGKGDINDDRAYLNGYRIYANKEVILKGDYIAKGYVVDYYVAD